MRSGKLLYGMMAVVLGGTLFIAACGAEPVSDATESDVSVSSVAESSVGTIAEATSSDLPDNTEEESATPEVAELILGEKGNGERVVSISLTNRTGEGIFGATLHIGDIGEDAGTAEDLLPAGETFKNGETRVLYYDLAKLENIEQQDATRDLAPPSVKCDIELLFSEDEAHTLHGFPMEDMEEGDILLEDGVAFLQYTSVSAGEVVSTLEAERAAVEIVVEPVDQQEEPGYGETTQTSGQSDTQHETNQEPEPPVSEPAVQEEPVVDDPNAGCLDDVLIEEEPAQSNPAPETPVQDEPVQETVVQEEIPVQETPVEEDSYDPNAGCLADVLIE